MHKLFILLQQKRKYDQNIIVTFIKRPSKVSKNILDF